MKRIYNADDCEERDSYFVDSGIRAHKKVKVGVSQGSFKCNRNLHFHDVLI